MLLLAGAAADVDSFGAVVRTRFHQYPRGSLLICLQATAHVQHPTQRFVSITMAWWGVLWFLSLIAVTSSGGLYLNEAVVVGRVRREVWDQGLSRFGDLMRQVVGVTLDV